MALTLSIKSCFEKCSSSLIITDNTGVGASNDGTGRWEDDISGSDITSIEGAILIITYPNGTQEEIDITDEIPSTVTYDIEFSAISGTFPDGLYKIQYIITTNSNTYSKTIHSYNFSNAACCINNLWKGLPAKICPGCNYKEYINNCYEAESFLTALKCAVSCYNYSSMDDIVTKIKDICELEDCTTC